MAKKAKPEVVISDTPPQAGPHEVQIQQREPLKVGDKVLVVTLGQIAAIAGGQAHIHILQSSITVPEAALKRG